MYFEVICVLGCEEPNHCQQTVFHEHNGVKCDVMKFGFFDTHVYMAKDVDVGDESTHDELVSSVHAQGIQIAQNRGAHATHHGDPVETDHQEYPGVIQAGKNSQGKNACRNFSQSP